MGIFLKQWTLAEFVYRDGKCLGTQRIEGLPLMTRADAEAALAKAKGNFCVINTKSE